MNVSLKLLACKMLILEMFFAFFYKTEKCCNWRCINRCPSFLQWWHVHSWQDHPAFYHRRCHSHSLRVYSQHHIKLKKANLWSSFSYQPMKAYTLCILNIGLWMQKIWKIKKLLSNGGEFFLEMCVSCVLYYTIHFCLPYHNDEVG